MAIQLILSDMHYEKQQDDSNICKITPHNDISKEDLLEMITSIYDEEIKEECKDVYKLNLKGLSVEKIADVLRYALTREDLKNASTILNIYNLIKIYNTLDDSFFEDENIWVNNLEELLDLKLMIRAELKEFSTKFSIYFLSLIKSYNKITYTPMDNNIELPSIFQTLFLSMDFMTAAGVFSTTNNINTSELLVIRDSIKYLTDMMAKNCLGIGLLNNFLEEYKG
jgi:hypothetical protein